ncbi:MAG: hypothetical protein GY812_12700 [Actinomycetia bacterium]|nr:hypothetical protein [Actinomycetes bacterium]
MNTHTAHNENTTTSFFGRNGRRLAAAALIAVAGSVGTGAVASAESHVPSPSWETVADPEPITPAHTLPQLENPFPIADVPDVPGHGTPQLTVPGVDLPDLPGRPTIDTIPGAPDFPDFPEIPTDPVDPDEYPGDEPGDTPTETTVAETTAPENSVPETTVPGFPDVEVEGEQDERTVGEELAYTGSDSNLPLVGGGLLLAGGLVAALSYLSRRSGLSQG